MEKVEKTEKAGLDDIKSSLVEVMYSIEESNQKIMKGEDAPPLGVDSGFTFGKHKSEIVYPPGTLHVISGRPGNGKSTYLISLAQNVICSKPHASVVLLTTESHESISYKILSGLARIDRDRVIKGKLTDKEWPRLAQAADMLSKSSFFYKNLFAGDLNEIKRLLKEHPKPIDLVLIDDFEFCMGYKPEMAFELKHLAYELNSAVVVSISSDSKVNNRPNKRPLLSELTDSFVRASDTVSFLYRDEIYNRDTEDLGILEFSVSKDRFRDTRTYRLAFVSEYGLIASLAE